MDPAKWRLPAQIGAVDLIKFNKPACGNVGTKPADADAAAATHTLGDSPARKDHQRDAIMKVAPAVGLSAKTNRQVDPF